MAERQDKSIKVLSIDFDYFQDVQKKVLDCYPDGIDYPTNLSTAIWNSHYAFKSEELQSVVIIHNELNKMKSILLNQEQDIPVMIANSHKHIYNFIYSNVPTDRKLRVFNADMHHDMYHENKELDCGNWVNFLTEDYSNCGVLWICNPISKELFGIERSPKLMKILPETLDIIKDTKFNAVFLCCSDMWTPPHLDKYFTELCDVMKGHFEEITIERGITEPRCYLDSVNELQRRIKPMIYEND